MKRLALLPIIFALALFFLLPACGGSGGSGGSGYNVAGNWQATNVDGVPVPARAIVFSFNPNGTGAWAGLGYTSTFTWAQSGNTLVLTENGQSDSVTLNWLTTNKVQIPDLDGYNIIFERI